MWVCFLTCSPLMCHSSQSWSNVFLSPFEELKFSRLVLAGVGYFASASLHFQPETEEVPPVCLQHPLFYGIRILHPLCRSDLSTTRFCSLDKRTIQRRLPHHHFFSSRQQASDMSGRRPFLPHFSCSTTCPPMNTSRCWRTACPRPALATCFTHSACSRNPIKPRTRKEQNIRRATSATSSDYPAGSHPLLEFPCLMESMSIGRYNWNLQCTCAKHTSVYVGNHTSIDVFQFNR